VCVLDFFSFEEIHAKTFVDNFATDRASSPLKLMNVFLSHFLIPFPLSKEYATGRQLSSARR
jgi:hypothetical protein